jgi:hypothetical protein
MKAFVNRFPTHAGEAVKIFKRNFGAAPTEMRLELEEQQRKEQTERRDQLDKVVRSGLGSQYNETSSLEENFALFEQQRQERIAAEQLSRELQKANDSRELLESQKKMAQLNWMSQSSTHVSVAAKEIRNRFNTYVAGLGVDDSGKLSDTDAASALTFLDQFQASVDSEIDTNLFLLPESQRNIVKNRFAIQVDGLRNSITRGDDIGNIKSVADNHATLMGSRAILNDPALAVMTGIGSGKFDPVTIGNAVRAASSARSDKDKIIQMSYNPKTTEEKSIIDGIFGTNTPTFRSIADNAENAGITNAGAAGGIVSLMNDSLNQVVANSGSEEDKRTNASAYAKIFSSMVNDEAMGGATGEGATVTLADKEAALLQYSNLSKEQKDILNAHLTDKEKENIGNVSQTYATEVLNATSEMIGETFGSVITEAGVESRPDKTFFGNIIDSLPEFVGLQTVEPPSVPQSVGEIIGTRADNGRVEFFIKDREFIDNESVKSTVKALNTTVMDRLNLIRKTAINGEDIGIQDVLASRPVQREVREEISELATDADRRNRFLRATIAQLESQLESGTVGSGRARRRLSDSELDEIRQDLGAARSELESNIERFGGSPEQSSSRVIRGRGQRAASSSEGDTTNSLTEEELSAEPPAPLFTKEQQEEIASISGFDKKIEKIKEMGISSEDIDQITSVFGGL